MNLYLSIPFCVYLSEYSSLIGLCYAGISFVYLSSGVCLILFIIIRPGTIVYSDTAMNLVNSSAPSKITKLLNICYGNRKLLLTLNYYCTNFINPQKLVNIQKYLSFFSDSFSFLKTISSHHLFRVLFSFLIFNINQVRRVTLK